VVKEEFTQYKTNMKQINITTNKNNFINCQKAPWGWWQLMLVRVQGHMADRSKFYDVCILKTSRATQ
jgi:hypothetical protein